MAEPKAINEQITDAVTQQAGALDAADVEIKENPDFTPEVVDLIADYVYDLDEDADA